MNNSSLRTSCFAILFLMPSLAYAHGFGLMFEWIAVIIYMAITIVHGGIIFILRWKKLFKHLWLTLLSLFVSIALLLFGFGIVGDFYANYMDPRYLPKRKDEFTLLFILVIVSMLAVFWLFYLPIKQYQSLSDMNDGTENSINSALGIKTTMKDEK